MDIIRSIFAAGDVKHWSQQRLTAIFSLLSGIWLLSILPKILVRTYAEILMWIQTPLNMILIIATGLVLSWHSSLGLQVIIEDYVQNIRSRKLLLYSCRIFHKVLFFSIVVIFFKITFLV